MTKIERVILVDLDNFDLIYIDQMMSLYTKHTKFVFFGIGERYVKDFPQLHHNKKKIEFLNNCFRFHADQLEFSLITKSISDGADMMMYDYVGKHILNWKNNSVTDVIIASNDNGIFNLAVTLKSIFNVRLLLARGLHGERFMHARKLGIVIPTIILRKKKK